MAIRARVTYSDFKDAIADAISNNLDRASEDKYDGKIDNETGYKMAVGKAAMGFKDKVFGTNAPKMDDAWKSWIELIEADFGDSWTIISQLDVGKIDDLKGKGTGRIERAFAIHYRLHCEFEYSEFAKKIDERVFGGAYESEFHMPVFELARPVIAPTAPFSHPPYYLYDGIREELRKSPTNGIWLDPHNHHSIPLSSREVEQATLTKFMEAPEPFLIQPLIAPSGAGKTRLVSQWMRKYVPSVSETEWDAGFIDSTKRKSRDPKPWAKWEISRPTLIVIDYTFAYDAVVHEIADQARRNPTPHKIRLLIVDHIYPKFLKDDYFWRKIFGSLGHLNLFERTIIQPPIKLRPVDLKSKLLRDVMAASASLGDKVIDTDDPLIFEAEGHLSRMSKTNGGEFSQDTGANRHPLFAALIGQVIRDAGDRALDFSKWTRRDLITYYFSNWSRLPWAVWNDERGVSVGALVCAATLRRGLPVDAQIRLSLGKDADDIIDYANRVVSSDNKSVVNPFLPDILGEAFLLFYLEFIEEDTKAYQSFIDLLSTESEYGQDQEFSLNFRETLARLVRNLANDNQSDQVVQHGWKSLSHFLDPNKFEQGTELRLMVSYAIIDAMERITNLNANAIMHKSDLEIDLVDEHVEFLKGVHSTIESQFSISDFGNISEGKKFVSATLEYFRYFENETSADTKTRVNGLKTIAQNFASNRQNSQTLLMMAASRGWLKTLRVLRVLINEDINVANHDGVTALMYASGNGHLDVVKYLREAIADFDAEYDNIATALMYASHKGHLEVVKYLHTTKADVNFAQDDGTTALIRASNQGHLDVVKYLHLAKADVNATHYDGTTAMMLASRKGHLDVVTYLHLAKVNINATHTSGITAFMMACSNGHLSVVKYLHNAKANINIADRDGTTALMIASQCGQFDVVSYLISIDGINLCSLDSDNHTALECAEICGHSDVAKKLRSAMAKMSTRDL